ncbi:hypothetical protein ACFQ0X_43660 [Streptomyces rectiviolaceus]|uniref:hypothetical protein n=1 Tax=Streptomyces rectiviolaceus TaxID=332591 RepID=UPI00363976BD
MRRPAQHHTRPALDTGWAHPYPAGLFSPVFYADGDPDPAVPPAPAPPKPAPPAVSGFSQEDLERIAAKEKSQGERAGARKALEDFAKEHGFSNVDDAKTFIAEARKAQQDALSEQERAQQQLADERKKIEQERAEAAADRRTLRREQALTRLGALDSDDAPNLQDALAMLDRDLRETPDADAATVAEAAEKLKKRRPELFGTASTPDPTAAPAAPSGMPAPGMPRPGASQPKPGERGLAMLKRRGKIPTDA